MARRCTRHRLVEDRFGRRVNRCASYSGAGPGGALGISPALLLTAAEAARDVICLPVGQRSFLKAYAVACPPKGKSCGVQCLFARTGMPLAYLACSVLGPDGGQRVLDAVCPKARGTVPGAEAAPGAAKLLITPPKVPQLQFAGVIFR